LKIILTAKVRIDVGPAEQALLDETMERYREACNHVSDYVFRTHDLKMASLNDKLYYQLRRRFGLKSQMAQSVIKTVVARYKAILDDKKKWIRAKFKRPQYDLVWNRDYSLTQEMFSVNTLSGRVKLPYFAKGMEKYFDTEKYRFGTAKLVSKKGKYFLHIPVTTEVEAVSDSEIVQVVGIDRGIINIITTYDGEEKTIFVSGRDVKRKRANFKRVRSELQRRQTPSSRRRLTAIGHRENRWIQDKNHCISKALVESYPEHTLFVLEDLTGIRSATEKVRLEDRYEIVSWSYYDLEQKLIYKAALHNDKVIKVDPRYTSQTCPVCGHVAKGNRDKKNHQFCCQKCGYKSNDDRIGAMNLYRKGISYLEEGKDSQVPDAVAGG